jgi:hypothetical protein
LLLPDFPNAGEVLLEIFNRVIENLMLFQEAIEFVARGNTQEHSELIAGDAPLAVGLKPDGFERSAGGVLARGRQLVRDFESDPHKYRLPPLRSVSRI